MLFGKVCLLGLVILVSWCTARPHRQPLVGTGVSRQSRWRQEHGDHHVWGVVATTIVARGGEAKNLTFALCKDDDGSASDPDGLPRRYLRMQNGNRPKALAALQETLQWRETHEVDTILGRPRNVTKFHACKRVLPHAFMGRDETGHVIFAQRPGLIQLDQAKEANVTMEDLLDHYIYLLEYCWNILEPRPDQTMTSLIDLKGASFSMFRSKDNNMVAFVREFVQMMSHHYPQRSHCTMLLNAPSWFGLLYRIFKPLLRESTKKKIQIYSGGPKQDEALRELLGEDSYACFVAWMEAEPDNSTLSRMEEDLTAFVESL